MQPFRYISVFFLVIGLAGCWHSTTNKLVGRWEMVAGVGTGSIFDFAANGTFTIRYLQPNGELAPPIEGTYRIAGDEITTFDKEGKDTAKIEKLTDNTMVSVDVHGKRYEFRKL